MDTVTWTTTHGDTVEVYLTKFEDGTLARLLGPSWRYRVRAANNKIVEWGESYTRRRAAVAAAERHHPRVGEPLPLPDHNRPLGTPGTADEPPS